MIVCVKDTKDAVPSKRLVSHVGFVVLTLPELNFETVQLMIEVTFSYLNIDINKFLARKAICY